MLSYELTVHMCSVTELLTYVGGLSTKADVAAIYEQQVVPKIKASVLWILLHIVPVFFYSLHST